MESGSIRRTHRSCRKLLPRAARGGNAEAGFMLVGLLIVVAVVNVTMMVVVSSWVMLDKRAREAELIFRGQAIARAITCYQQENAGEPLERLDQLVKANCLRRLYRDPMTKGGEWRLLRQEDLVNGTIAQLLGLETEQDEGQDGSASRLAVGVKLQLGSGTAGGPGGGATAAPPQQLLARPLQGPASSDGRRIIGVVSASKASGLRELRTRRKYGEWVFIAAS